MTVGFAWPRTQSQGYAPTSSLLCRGSAEDQHTTAPPSFYVVRRRPYRCIDTKIYMRAQSTEPTSTLDVNTTAIARRLYRDTSPVPACLWPEKVNGSTSCRVALRTTPNVSPVIRVRGFAGAVPKRANRERNHAPPIPGPLICVVAPGFPAALVLYSQNEADRDGMLGPLVLRGCRFPPPPHWLEADNLRGGFTL